MLRAFVRILVTGQQRPIASTRTLVARVEGARSSRRGIRLALASGAPTFGHLTAECQSRFGVGHEGGEAWLARVAVSDVAFEGSNSEWAP